MLTRAADYGLRGLLYLSKASSDRMVMAGEIAEAENMPEYFFSKIFQNLAKAGIVNSSRGSGGGFSLAKPPEQILLFDVLEAIEGSLCLSRCVDDPGSCPKSATCPFNAYLSEAQQSLYSVLRKYTLADAASYSRAAE
ncbi:MAG: Rrf2 family transcriptional regulator [Candidatus Abyssubacteria bacterium]